MLELPKSPGFRLDGKRALVAGASSGIGMACAAALAGAGASVTLMARRAEALSAVRDALQQDDGQADIMPLDIADIPALEDAVSANGPFDVLVNSAGLAIHSPALETRLDDFDQVMNLNVRGAYFLTRAVAKGLIAAAKSGSLINISSQMGKVGGIDRAVYCASKHAVEGFTKAMAIEWGAKNIRVNTICPTFIRTPLTEATFSDAARLSWVERRIQLGRVGELSDVMGAVVYLASDASEMVTGSALMVDGGWTAE